MKKHLQHPIFQKISESAADVNANAFVVGGFVRDIILGRESKDIDVVTEGNGIELANVLAGKLGGADVAVFKNFGTAMVKWNDLEIEFVGARKESYSKNSRKPKVQQGTLEDDLKRRDFTINAMAIDLDNNSKGEVIDPFDGLGDLKRKIIRTPLDPEITFSDDPLRMMRAIRFSSQLNFDIDPVTLKAIEHQRERIKIISMERVSEELNKILLSPKPSAGLKLLFDTKILHIIFPELAALHGVETINGLSHKDNFYHTLQVVDNISDLTNDLWLRWAALLHDIAKPATQKFEPGIGWTFHGHEDKGARMVPAIFRNLKLPMNQKMKYVQKLVLLHLRPIALTQSQVTDSALRRLLVEAGEDIEDLMLLCKADITSKNETRVKKYLKNFETVQQKLLDVEEKDRLRNWQPPISGNDIMEIFGLKPGPEIGKLKTAVREAILEGEIKDDRQSALRFVLKLAHEWGLEPVNQQVKH